MITCPRCGAENKDNATVCRMCATALDPASAGAPRPAGMPQDIPATVLVPSPGAPQQAAPAPGGKVMCPGCQATNDADWAFCQQCGTRLQAAPQPAAGPQPPAWGAPTVVTPSAPPAEPPQQWGAPTVIAPAPDFGQPQQPPQNMPPAWGAPTVVTPAAPPAPPAPPPQAPQAPVWGAPTVVTPAPDFAQFQQQQQPPPPPQPTPNMPPVWGAPTVVTPVPPDMMQPPMGNPPPGDQRYIQTIAAPNAKEIDSYPETIVTPQASTPAPSSGTEPIGDAAATAQVPRAPEAAAESPAGGAGGGPTADMSRPPMPPPPMPGVPPGGASTIVMSSTPVASPPRPAKLLLIMEGGEVGETFGLRPAETVIGRVDGDIKFPHDGYMSSRHARILQRNGRFFLIDNNSRNGTFVKIHQEVELHPGDVILVGKQLFRFETDE